MALRGGMSIDLTSKYSDKRQCQGIYRMKGISIASSLIESGSILFESTR